MPREIFDKNASSASEKARYTKSAPIIKVLISIILKNLSQTPPPLTAELFVRRTPLKLHLKKRNLPTTETAAEVPFRK